MSLKLANSLLAEQSVGSIHNQIIEMRQLVVSHCQKKDQCKGYDYEIKEECCHGMCFGWGRLYYVYSILPSSLRRG